MTTVVLNIPDKKENQLMSYFKKLHLKVRVIEKEEDEDLIAKWIDEGIKSEEVPEEEIVKILKRNGAKI